MGSTNSSPAGSNGLSSYSKRQSPVDRAGELDLLDRGADRQVAVDDVAVLELEHVDRNGGGLDPQHLVLGSAPGIRHPVPAKATLPGMFELRIRGELRTDELEPGERALLEGVTVRRNAAGGFRQRTPFELAHLELQLAAVLGERDVLRNRDELGAPPLLPTPAARARRMPPTASVTRYRQRRCSPACPRNGFAASSVPTSSSQASGHCSRVYWYGGAPPVASGNGSRVNSPTVNVNGPAEDASNPSGKPAPATADT